MYKSILYSNNLETLKKMYNTIFSNLNNSCVNLTQIITNEEDLLKLHHNLNLIIFSDFEITSKNFSTLINNFENKIIFTKNLANHKNTKYILYLPITANEQYIKDKLTKFVLKHNKDYIYQKVHKILESINLDFKLVGANYLVEAITYSYIHKEEYLFENLEKNIYPHVSKVYNVTAENIKWSIIRALNYLKVNPNNNIITSTEKITPKLLITQVINLI